MKKYLLGLFGLILTSNVLAHGMSAGQFASFDPGLGFGQLSSNWKELGKETANIETEGNGYYIVSVENKAESKTLYFLMSAAGKIYDANFTGAPPKVK